MECVERSRGSISGRPSYHELFAAGYKVNPADVTNSVSLTRLPHYNRLNITAKKSV